MRLTKLFGCNNTPEHWRPFCWASEGPAVFTQSTQQPKRQLPRRFPRQTRHRIRKRRCQRWQPGLAHAGRRFGAGHDVHGHLGHVGDAWHGKVAKVALIHHAVLQCDGAAGHAH